jgi:hypothetical protein
MRFSKGQVVGAVIVLILILVFTLARLFITLV